MPVLSKICPGCGYFDESDEDSYTPTEFANILEKILFEIKRIPEPSFLKGMSQLTFIIFPLLTVFMFALALISEAGLFWILGALFLIFSIIALVKKSKGTLGNDKFNKQFKEEKHAFEYYQRIAIRDFGKSREVSKLANEIEGMILDIEQKRKKASTQNMLIWAVILIVVVVLASGGTFQMDRALNKVEDTVEEAMQKGSESWQSAIDELKGMSDSDFGVEQKRIDITQMILEANAPEAAETFFVDYCMGNRMDFEAASLIVNYYKGKGETEKATQFIAKCSKMRYSSDLKKLKKIIE
ncbi:hypothetical protein D0T87_00475 [Bacteroides sp. 51]|nr:hypothetical protein [Bacteroides sp. 51]